MVKYRFFSKSLKPKYFFSSSSINSNSLSQKDKSFFSNNNFLAPFQLNISSNGQLCHNNIPHKKSSCFKSDKSSSSFSPFKNNENSYGFNESLFLINSLNINNTEIKKKILYDNSPSKFRKKQKKTFTCKCGKSYKRNEYLQKHIFYTHSGYKGKVCNLCGKFIKRFRDHLRLCKMKHTLNKKFIIKKNQIHDTNKNNTTNISPFHLVNAENKDDKKYFQNFLKIEGEEDFINLEKYKYYLNYMIGSGGNMEVFYGIEKNTKQDVAVKIEIKEKKKSGAINEAVVLTALQGISKIPNFYSYQYKKKKNIIIESLFGPSLYNFLIIKEFNFEMATVAIIGIQIINILKQIHQRAIIHNDIKPKNICWGRFSYKILI